MKAVVIVGSSFGAWLAARDAARDGAQVRFLVTPGAADAMAPFFAASFDWPAVYDLPRYATVSGRELSLPLDPVDVIGTIGLGAWTRDVAGLVRRGVRHRASTTVGDVARRDLGRPLAERLALPWLAARYGSEGAPAEVLDPRHPMGWIRMSDGEAHVRDAIWASGGDVVEDVHIIGVERVHVNGIEHVVALETAHGLEHVDGDLFVDAPEAQNPTFAEFDGPDGVIEYTRPEGGVWREVRHDGTIFRFGPSFSSDRIIPDLGNVRRIGSGPLPAPAFSPTDPFSG